MVTPRLRLFLDQDLSVLEHKEGDWVTLFTCESYGEFWGDHGYRRMVQAILVDVNLSN